MLPPGLPRPAFRLAPAAPLLAWALALALGAAPAAAAGSPSIAGGETASLVPPAPRSSRFT